MNTKDQCIEVGSEIMRMKGTRNWRRFDILNRRFQRLIKAQTSIEDIDYILDELRKRFPNENKPGGVLYAQKEEK